MFYQRKFTAIALSLVVHAALLAAILYQHASHLYKSVEGLEVGDFGGQSTVRLINPADYGYGRKPALAAPRRAASLEELERRRKTELAKRKAELARKEARQAAKRQAAEDAADSAAEQAAGTEPDSGEPKFGRIDTSPLRRHVAVLWQAHESGSLDLPESFRIVVSCSINPDGSFSGIRVVESSGSRDLDGAALAILEEISNQRAFAPLSRLSSVSLMLDVGPRSAGFSVTGFAPNAALAADMAGKYQSMLSAARLFASNPQARLLLGNASVRSDLSRVSARLSIPRSTASEMMQQSFSSAG